MRNFNYHGHVPWPCLSGSYNSNGDLIADTNTGKTFKEIMKEQYQTTDSEPSKSKPKSKPNGHILKALASLLHFAYMDELPNENERESLKELAHNAIQEYDALLKIGNK